MTPGMKLFYRRLDRGPAVLLLGQAHMLMDETTDLIEEARSLRYPSSEDGGPWNWLLSADPAAAPWLSTKLAGISPSSGLRDVAEYPWSSVLGSSVDTVWQSAFGDTARRTRAVLDPTELVPDPRNPLDLVCWYLFGSLPHLGSAGGPPDSPAKLLKRGIKASDVLSQLPVLLGPSGTLVVAGLHDHDWLSPDLLVATLARLGPEQAHLFELPDEYLSNSNFKLLEEAGIACHHGHISAAQALRKGMADSRIKGLDSLPSSGAGAVVSIGQKALRVDRSLLLDVERFAHVLSEDDLIPPTVEPNADLLYAEFRDYLGRVGPTDTWYGPRMGFPFERAFERDVRKLVTKAAALGKSFDTPVVIEGAAGTGKTTALERLAFSLGQKRQYPVVFIPRNTQMDKVAEVVLSDFVEWAERAGEAQATILFWDGNRKYEEYFGLSRYFASRGRRVVVVGSSYPTRESNEKPPGLVSAPSFLSKDEGTRLSSHLAKFGIDVAVPDRESINFLVLLYRALPSTRAPLREGVVREVEHVERELALYGEQLAVRTEHRTAMAAALADAGVTDSKQLTQEENLELAGEAVSAATYLLTAVMVAAQFGVAVPLGLAMRATNDADWSELIPFFERMDAIRWESDKANNILLTSRTSLEAKIITEAKLGPSWAQAWAASDLIRSLRPGISDSSSAELNFAVKLLQRFQKSAEEVAPNVRRLICQPLADALLDLREGGLSEPRLVLQEAKLLRTIAKAQFDMDDPSGAVSINAAVAALEAAIEKESNNVQLRTQLRVELASALGTATVHAWRGLGTGLDSEDHYSRSNNLTALAQLDAPDNFYAVDVACWLTISGAQQQALSEIQLAEGITNIWAGFESVDYESLSPDDRERFVKRQQEIADLDGDLELAESSFQKLLEMGSGAGVFLRARRIANPYEMSQGGEIDDAAISEAMDLMAKYPEVTRTDPRCARLHFHLWWLKRAGSMPGAGERQTIALDRDGWSEAKKLSGDLLELQPERNQPSIRLVHYVSLFHLGEIRDAKAGFAELARLQQSYSGLARVKRAYRLADATGTPLTFRGNITRLVEDAKRGTVFVEDLRESVPFFEVEFQRQHISVGSNLRDFHIAFNMLGALADPVQFGAN